MSSNVYLEIAEIPGESGVTGFTTPMEVLNFSYSCFQPVAEARSGTIHTSGRANHGTLNISKQSDLATGKILEMMWSGVTMKKATLTACTNNGTTLLKYLVMTLTEVVVTNYSLHGGGNSIPGEEVSFSFGSIQVQYNKHKEDGTAEGKSVAGWDLKTEAVLQAAS